MSKKTLKEVVDSHVYATAEESFKLTYSPDTAAKSIEAKVEEGILATYQNVSTTGYTEMPKHGLVCPTSGLPCVHSLESLAIVAANKGSVYSPGLYGGKPKPAAFILSQQGAMILKAFKLGLYPYVKKTPPKTDPGFIKG